jgi:DNA replication protein DnaC
MDRRHLRLAAWGDLKVPSTGAECWRRAVQNVRAFVEGGSGGILILVGQRGVGKSQLLTVAVESTIRGQRPARIITAVELMGDLKVRYDQHDEDGGDRGWLRSWGAPYLLAVDEIGERLDSAWSGTMLTALLDQRYRSMKPTILAGNVTLDNLAAVIGDSAVSRSLEDGGAIECSWASFRGQELR